MNRTIMNRMMIRGVLITALILVLVVSLTAACWNSGAIASITVTAIDPAQEPQDPVVLGIGAEHQMPDYQLQIVNRHNVRESLGSFANQSAQHGLTWECENPYPLAAATRLRLLDEDKLNSDLVEEIRIDGQQFASENYRYTIETTWSWRAGASYFFMSTPMGWILIGLFVLIGIFLASNIVVPSIG